MLELRALNGIGAIMKGIYLTLSLNEGGIMLSKDSVENFQRIFKEQYGEDLTEEEVRESGENLVRYVKLLIEMDQASKK